MSSPTKPRVRFAPSPTGYLHVGGARTAIFNWLFAKHVGGDFLLRIEDTDQARYDEKAFHELIADLKWLGLDWDEGPEVGGPHAPYFQSQRLPLYHEHAQILVTGGHAYPCFCTSERLDGLREQQKLNNLPTSYDRLCRSIPTDVAKQRVDAGEKHTIRLKVPFHGNTVFKDFLRGTIDYQNRILDDMVLMKTDGFPTYHLANVVDDHFMQITHVLRGDEWIPSTPRHVLLYQAFGWEPPIFVHLPVILSADGGKLSKRKGAASVGDYRDLGYMPHTMVNFLSLLGWSPGGDLEIMEIEKLIEMFTLEKINPKSAAFDEKKLEWLNGQFFLRREPEFLVPLVKPLWEKTGIDLSAFDDAYILKAVALLKDRSKRLPDFVTYGLYFFQEPETYDEKVAKKYFMPGGEKLIDDLSELLANVPSFDAPTLEVLYRTTAESMSLKGGDLIHPTRLAISGIPFGPGLFELMAALGRDTVLRRLRKASEAIRTEQVKTAPTP